MKFFYKKKVLANFSSSLSLLKKKVNSKRDERESTCHTLNKRKVQNCGLVLYKYGLKGNNLI